MTRACYITLKDDKCEIDYIHYGLDFVIKLFYEHSGDVTSTEVKQLLKSEIEKVPWHIDVTDRDTINRLFKYETDIIPMDSEIFLFCEDKGHFVDLTLKWSDSKE